MSDTIVHLIRHAETHNPDHVVYADIPGFGLSERGKAQAESTAAYLSGRPIAAVYASPLQRAMETAVPIASDHSVVVRTVPELTEWRLSDRWEGRPWDDLDQEFPGELDAYLKTPLDLPFSPESLEALAHRMTDAIGDLAARLPKDEIVIVSHQDPIQAARLALTHRTLADLQKDKPEHGEVFTFEIGVPWTLRERWAPPGLPGAEPGPPRH